MDLLTLPYFIISAFRGNLSDDMNDILNLKLCLDLRLKNLDSRPVTGITSQWGLEAAHIIFTDDFPFILSLAHKYHQDGFIEFSHDGWTLHDLITSDETLFTQMETRPCPDFNLADNWTIVSDTLAFTLR